MQQEIAVIFHISSRGCFYDLSDVDYEKIWLLGHIFLTVIIIKYNNYGMKLTFSFFFLAIINVLLILNF